MKLLNSEIKKKQQWMLLGVSLVVAVVVLVVIFMLNHGKHHKTKKTAPNLAGITNTDFVGANTQSRLSVQQADMDALQAELKALKAKVAEDEKAKAKAALKEKKALASRGEENQRDAKAQGLAGLSKRTKTHPLTPPRQQLGRGQGGNGANNLDALGSSHIPAQAMGYGMIEVTNFSYPETKTLAKHTPDNYVPSGSFAKAVILGGADADASVNGQGNTSELLLRILDAGTIPGGKHSHLKNCTALASVYGDISSERGLVRLQSLSCTFKHGRILDIPVQGWAFYSGKSGIKGVPVMRNGPILAWAGLSGLLSGIGQSLSQAQSTQSTSALGTTTTVPTSRIASSGLYSGAGTAMDRLANYYIKRADQYHPIIEIGAGNVVTLVFQKGFSLDPEHPITPSVKKSTHPSQTMIPKNILDQIRGSHIGQSIGGAVHG